MGVPHKKKKKKKKRTNNTYLLSTLIYWIHVPFNKNLAVAHLTIKRVVCTPIARQNHLYWHFKILLRVSNYKQKYELFKTR